MIGFWKVLQITGPLVLEDFDCFASGPVLYTTSFQTIQHLNCIAKITYLTNLIVN